MKVTAPTALIAMQAATVLAAPFQGGSSLVARQEEEDNSIWKEKPGANGWATVEYGDGKLNYGARVPSTILDVIRDECPESACNPAGDYGFSTRVVNANRESDVSYTIKVEGSFAKAGERGDKAQLLQLAKMAYETVYNNDIAIRRQGVMYITGECPAWQTEGCPGQGVGYTDQWESVSHVHVRIENEEGTLTSYLNVGVTMDDSSLNPGICAALGAAATGLSFAGPGGAGAAAGFALASITCGAI